MSVHALCDLTYEHYNYSIYIIGVKIFFIFLFLNVRKNKILQQCSIRVKISSDSLNYFSSQVTAPQRIYVSGLLQKKNPLKYTDNIDKN